MKNTDYRNVIETKTNIKRYVITAFCTIPLLIIIGILLGDSVNRFVRILIFIATYIVVLVIVELIHKKIKQQKVVVEKEDVFK